MHLWSKNRVPSFLKKVAAAVVLLGAFATSVARAQVTLNIVYSPGTDSVTFTYSGVMGVNSTGAVFSNAVSHVDTHGFEVTDYPSDTPFAAVTFSTFQWSTSGAIALNAATASGDIFGFNSSSNRVWGPDSFTSGSSISGSVSTLTGYTLADIGFTDGSSGSIIGAGGAFVVNWTASGSPIPEPSTSAIVMGVAAAGCIFWRAQRRKVAS